MRKKRGYNREVPVELMRDYTLFAIACEGGKREPDYFKLFQFFSPKIKVDIIEEVIGDDNSLISSIHKSSPRWVLERAVKYIEREGLNEEDELWFVMDTDRWEVEQLREVAEYCNQFSNWHIVLSNPCFEVWLYFHKKTKIQISRLHKCKHFKTEISTLEKGGYHQLKFIENLPEAIKNAKATDTDKNHFFPGSNISKVYELAEAAIKVSGKTRFDEFVKSTLPLLKEQEFKKTPSRKPKRSLK